jgi:ribose transport system substrate-binding protein
MIVLRKQISFALLFATLPLLTGCLRHSKSEHFYLVATSTKHAYWQSAWAGFSKAAAEYGVSVDMRGPDGFDPQDEVAEFRQVVALKPAGILVSVANESLLQPGWNSGHHHRLRRSQQPSALLYRHQ